MPKEQGMVDGSVEVLIEVDPKTGDIAGWCATLKELGLYDCPLLGLDGELRDCDGCYCG